VRAIRCATIIGHWRRLRAAHDERTKMPHGAAEGSSPRGKSSQLTQAKDRAWALITALRGPNRGLGLKSRCKEMRHVAQEPFSAEMLSCSCLKVPRHSTTHSWRARNDGRWRGALSLPGYLSSQTVLERHVSSPLHRDFRPRPRFGPLSAVIIRPGAIFACVSCELFPLGELPSAAPWGIFVRSS